LKFSIRLSEQECNDVFGAIKAEHDFPIVINGRKFDCHTAAMSSYSNGNGWFGPESMELEIDGYGEDKKAEEIAQAKAEVNRTKEAHKKAQRKLSALMEDK
jgi:hypothetical protein